MNHFTFSPIPTFLSVIISLLIIQSCSTEPVEEDPMDDDPVEVVYELIPGDGVSDLDGNEYETVIIGEQEWMAENLRVCNYKNGEPITFGEEQDQWANTTGGLWTFFGNDPDNDIPFGKLYNAEVFRDARGIAPDGWHVPTIEEWEELIEYMGGSNEAGAKLKGTGTINEGNGFWNSPNVDATDLVGFNAIAGGFLDPSSTADPFFGLGRLTVYWSSSPFPDFPNGFNTLGIWHNQTSTNVGGEFGAKGFSIRLIKD